MNTKEKFKEFARNNPSLLVHIKNGNMTWQKFYEMYDMYGEDNDIWNDYLTRTSVTNSFDLMGFLKTLDLDSIQEGINSVQRVLGVFQDMTNKKTDVKSKPRPLYKHFDD